MRSIPQIPYLEAAIPTLFHPPSSLIEMQELLTITDGLGGVFHLRTEKNTTETGAQQTTCLFLIEREHRITVAEEYSFDRFNFTFTQDGKSIYK